VYGRVGEECINTGASVGQQEMGSGGKTCDANISLVYITVGARAGNENRTESNSYFVMPVCEEHQCGWRGQGGKVEGAGQQDIFGVRR
jgi:hypothetical protein